MSESKEVIKPIFIGVATTVLATVVLYYFDMHKPSPSDESSSGPKTLQSTVITKEASTQSQDAGFERRKQSTLRVWNRMQEIDMQSDFNNPSSSTFQRIAYLYGLVDMSEADPLLVTHISEATSLYNEAMHLYGNYEAEIVQVQQAYMYDWQRQEAFQGVQAKYQSYFYDINQRCAEINNRDKVLARMFTEKYDVPFVD